MMPLLLILAGVCLLALIAGWWRNLRYRRRGVTPPPPQTPRPDGCCGQHEICEKESLLAAASRDIEYYDDEELDAFRGRPSDAYTSEEVEQFQDILYTMRGEEVAGWVRSLQLRGVALPDDLKDEVLMIVGERRNA